MRVIAQIAVLLLVWEAGPAAQTSLGPFTEAAKGQFDEIYALVLRAGEKIGDDLYTFKPTPDVRSIAGVIGHIADGNVLLCTAASGQKPEITRTHEKQTTKLEVLAALRQSREFCDAVIAKMTDTTGRQPSPAFDPSQRTPRLSWIHANTSHMWEHYGNLVTYMRLKNIVPPSSEKR